MTRVLRAEICITPHSTYVTTLHLDSDEQLSLHHPIKPVTILAGVQCPRAASEPQRARRSRKGCVDVGRLLCMHTYPCPTEVT
jgi:hypothetical protein